MASAALRVFAELTKPRIATLASLSAAAGYVVFCRTLNPGIATATLGTLFLATGACAMNQFQDRDIDARMERTRGRPIPAGIIPPAAGLAIALFLVFAGVLLLWLLHNPAAALIGLFTVGWYNGVYTCLKRIWAFAVVPGALTGALPPVIGWTAAGGNFLDPQVLALSFFFLIWQMPHFWLMLFMFGAEYEKAGLPSLTRRFSKRQLTSLSFIWMLATATSSLLLPFYFVTSSPAVSLGLVVGGFWFAWEAWKLMRDKGRNQRYTMAFRSINLYAVCVMVLLIVDVMM